MLVTRARGSHIGKKGRIHDGLGRGQCKLGRMISSFVSLSRYIIMSESVGTLIHIRECRDLTLSCRMLLGLRLEAKHRQRLSETSALRHPGPGSSVSSARHGDGWARTRDFGASCQIQLDVHGLTQYHSSVLGFGGIIDPLHSRVLPWIQLSTRYGI